MTIKTNITGPQAANLAIQYADCFRMVREVSAFHLPAGTSPRQSLEGYLQAAKICGVTLHNDVWEAEAEHVVQLLTQKRRDAWAKALSKSAVEVMA